MTEEQFKAELAEFTSKTAADLRMDDDLAALGVDSIGIFEFQMKMEDALGSVEIHEGVKSVQDLHDCILTAAEQSI